MFSLSSLYEVNRPGNATRGGRSTKEFLSLSEEALEILLLFANHKIKEAHLPDYCFFLGKQNMQICLTTKIPISIIFKILPCIPGRWRR
jgi:hypothetical protein